MGPKSVSGDLLANIILDHSGYPNCLLVAIQLMDVWAGMHLWPHLVCRGCWGFFGLANHVPCVLIRSDLPAFWSQSVSGGGGGGGGVIPIISVAKFAQCRH